MVTAQTATTSLIPIDAQLKHVLFATDFSQNSLAALPFAASIAQTFDSDLHLFHAVIPDESPMIVEADVRFARAHDEARRRMRDLARSSLLIDVKIGSEEVAHGGIELLKKRIEEKRIDLIVVGTHGRTGFERILLGSFTEHLIRSAPCPVLTVGPRIKKGAEQEFRPKQVLFATDASADSFRALPYAILFAEKRCELTLLHVLSGAHERTPKADAFLALMRDGLHNTIPLETIRRCNPEIVIKFGDPVNRILEAAAERESELIVMGTRSSEIKKKQKCGAGVSYGVIVKATCPVLTVRGREF